MTYFAPLSPLAHRMVRGTILNPQSGGTVDFLPDGALVADDAGILRWVGLFADLPPAFAALPVTTVTNAVITPPFLDLHTHIPQHPLKGRFTEGVIGDPPEGRLLAGLNRNVFPEEGRDADAEYAAHVVRAFRNDTLSHGVVGGAAYMTVHTGATRAALNGLPDTWHIGGPLLMDQNCPPYLRTDTDALEQDLRRLAEDYGKRVIVTDRFAVAASTPLRRRASHIAVSLGLRTQTHLNEQRAEKALIEHTLYPPSDGYASYTDVYRRDGLLDSPGALLAHCLQMTPPEWQIVADSGAVVVHCPTSNTLLGSGILPLDDLPASVPYALCTDVGASPTCSLLAEMREFLSVHQGRSRRAAPEEALYRVTLVPAEILGIADQLGSFAPGKPLSFITVSLGPNVTPPTSADTALRRVLEMPAVPLVDSALEQARTRLAAEGLPHGPALALLTTEVHANAHRFTDKVTQVVLHGKTVYLR